MASSPYTPNHAQLTWKPKVVIPNLASPQVKRAVPESDAVPSNSDLEMALNAINSLLTHMNLSIMKIPDSIVEDINIMCSSPRLEPQLAQFWRSFLDGFRSFATEYAEVTRSLTQLRMAKAEHSTCRSIIELEIIKFQELCLSSYQEFLLKKQLIKLQAESAEIEAKIVALAANREKIAVAKSKYIEELADSFLKIDVNKINEEIETKSLHLAVLNMMFDSWKGKIPYIFEISNLRESREDDEVSFEDYDCPESPCSSVQCDVQEDDDNDNESTKKEEEKAEKIPS
ncbi:hypothetical protein COLO4_27221 [Corchorus olitorius]|uniref:Uncharacterized protein n=1 Tax=Corchorus olitorius TaxID=93759 RepID=A0A1R3HS36_9ROSI|nr:hypothetical protein COLO4_27221 [Corchorus olitorius]